MRKQVLVSVDRAETRVALMEASGQPASKAAIRAFLGPFLKDAQSANFEIKHTTSAGNVVMNERVDHFAMGSKKIDLPVAGVFEIRNGKIAAWRDYFDLATFTKQMGG